MSTEEITATNSRQELSICDKKDQYTLWQILGIWALATLLMVLLTWVVAPAIILYSPLQPGILELVTG